MAYQEGCSRTTFFQDQDSAAFQTRKHRKPLWNSAFLQAEQSQKQKVSRFSSNLKIFRPQLEPFILQLLETLGFRGFHVETYQNFC